jgi:hypothetical protein
VHYILDDMSFALESDLCRTLADRWPSHLGADRRLTVLREVRVGTIIPDQVVVRSGPHQVAGVMPRLTLFESEVLAAIVARARQATSIAGQLFSRVDKILDVLRRMERLGVVESRPGRSYRVTMTALPMEIEVVAVEAKLTRWREAISQAVEYQRFANQVYVALPHTTVDDNFLPCYEECGARGLGLMAVSPESSELLLEARRETPATAEWFWLVSRLSRSASAAGLTAVQGSE